MAKKKIIRKSNRTLNLFADGGDIKQTWGQQAKSSFQSAFSSKNLGSTLGGIGSAVGTIVNAGIQNAQIANTSDLEGGIKQAQAYTVQANNNDDLMSEWGMFSPIKNVSWKDIRGGSTGQRIGNTIGAAGAGAGAGATVGGPIGAIVGGVVGLGSAIGGWIGGNRKAKKKAKKFNKQINVANEKNMVALEDKAENIGTQNAFNTLANFSAYGGPINIFGSGAIDYELAKEDLYNKQLSAMSKYKMSSMPNSFETPELNTFAKGGKIHIKPENRGKFTDYYDGKVTSECIARGKGSKSAAVRKRATFAANARKWHHAFGGDLLTHGAEWDNGLRIIGNGGTHEENPMEGVPMGMDAEGTPNLVEQGEVIFNDYVFSNRMFADSSLLESFNLPKSYDGYSFAAIAEKLGEESKERPNDPISKKGLLSSMSKLQQAQEIVRQQTQQTQEGQEGMQYAGGGELGRLFNKGRDLSLDGVDYEDWEGYGTLLEHINARNKEKDKEKDKERATNKSSNLTWLRYAPVVGSAIGLGQNLFSKPDYTSANAILEAANQAGNYTPVEYTPIGNYLQYRPFDRNFYLNKLNAQAGATRRAIMNTTSPSRNAALLAADYNAQGRLGDLARQAEEYNLAQRQAVENFNRGTNMANAEMGLKAAMANQEAALRARSSRLHGVAQAMAVRDAVDARRGASMSANLANLFDNLGNIGIDEMNREDKRFYLKYVMGANLPLAQFEKEFGREAAIEEAKSRGFTDDEIANMFKANGGYLTIKRKRGKNA